MRHILRYQSHLQRWQVMLLFSGTWRRVISCIFTEGLERRTAVYWRVRWCSCRQCVSPQCRSVTADKQDVTCYITSAHIPSTVTQHSVVPFIFQPYCLNSCKCHYAKVKARRAVFVHAMEAVPQSPTCRWLTRFTPRPLYSRWGDPRFPLKRELGGLQRRCVWFEEENN